MISEAPATKADKRAQLSDISVIVCTLNEEKNMPLLLPRIPVGVREVIIVDGQSTDKTVSAAREARPSVRVLVRHPRGRGDALNVGAAAATGKYILFIDADGSQLPEEIPDYIMKINEGCDMVKGSRFLPGSRSEDETRLRRVIIIIAQTVANFLWRTHYTDTAYGLCLVDREKFLGLGIKARGFDFEWEVAAKAKRYGLKVGEVPAVETMRIHGDSHLNLVSDGWVIAKRVFGEFFKIVLKRGD